MEAAYGERAREIATELALHFGQGRDYPRAVRYLQQAGENAVRRNAHQETAEPDGEHNQTEYGADVLQYVSYFRMPAENRDRGPEHGDPLRSPTCLMRDRVPGEVRPGADEDGQQRYRPAQRTLVEALNRAHEEPSDPPAQ